MSIATTGNDGWVWNAFFRVVAEPLMMKIARVTEEDADDEDFLAAPTPAGVFGGIEEDAERWDGLS